MDHTSPVEGQRRISLVDELNVKICTSVGGSSLQDTQKNFGQRTLFKLDNLSMTSGKTFDHSAKIFYFVT